MKTEIDSSGESRAAAVPLRRARGGLLAFYALVLALNAGSLHRNNEIMPYGPVRSFWLAASGPVAAACAALKLDRPRAFLARTAGKALNE
ncbi:MAG: hypothetical protein EOM72_05625 [Opitutae bacterium]|nr:hypothetical protein [Opitutae bacterium]